MIHFYPKEKRHFRARLTSVRGKGMLHPSYIVGEDENFYYSFGITHSSKKGRGHKNHLLKRNPEIGKTENSYLRKQLDRDWKKQYSKRPLDGFEMDEEDDEYVTRLLMKRK